MTTSQLFMPSPLLDPDGSAYTWAELLSLLEHWRAMGEDVPLAIRMLPDGRVVDARHSDRTAGTPITLAKVTR